jgi:hypothetical protein
MMYTNRRLPALPSELVNVASAIVCSFSFTVGFVHTRHPCIHHSLLSTQAAEAST